MHKHKHIYIHAQMKEAASLVVYPWIRYNKTAGVLQHGMTLWPVFISNSRDKSSFHHQTHNYDYPC